MIQLKFVNILSSNEMLAPLLASHILAGLPFKNYFAFSGNGVFLFLTKGRSKRKRELTTETSA